MGLLDDFEKTLARDYIQVSTVIDVLAKYEDTYKNMYQLLSHFKLNQVLTCYKLDEKLRLIDKDENNHPFDILKNREIILGLEFLRSSWEGNKYFATDEEIKKIDEDQFRQCENSGNGLSKFYWSKKEFISIDSLKPLTKILFDEKEIISLGKDHESLTNIPNIECQNLKVEILGHEREAIKKSVEEEKTYLKPKGKSPKKEEAMKTAVEIALSLIKNDANQKLRTAELCEQTYKRLVDEYRDELPSETIGIKAWINTVLPEYAKRGGRPKK